MWKMHSANRCILLLTLLVACNGHSKHPIFDDVCDAPCWRGITMGMYWDDVLKKLELMPDVSKETIKTETSNRPYLEKTVFWKFNSTKGFGNVIFQNDQVIKMFFPLFKELSLRSLIKLYGQPDSIIIRVERLDATFINVYFLNREKGICFFHGSDVLFIFPKEFRLKPSTRISRVYYADTSMPDWIFNIGCGGLDKKIDSQLIQTWKGYGEYPIIDPIIPINP